MRIFNRFFSAIVCTVAFMSAGRIAMAATPLSKYGQIQNVQNYSTNPFWSPGAPYNQRMPQPVYATGPDVETADCQTVVGNLVAAQCAMHNKCIDTRLSDIRPAVMMQLSQMPGHNYATACAGYIDAAFAAYTSQNANAGPNGMPTAFPSATMPSPKTEPVKFENPYAPKQLPQWMQDMKDRKQELNELQAQNGAGGEKIARADFPKTASDLSFVDRMKNEAAGYEPYKDATAYVPLNVETKQEQLTRMAERAQKEKELADAYREIEKYQLLPAEYCKKYPQDTAYCQQIQNQQATTNQQKSAIIQAIATALKEAQK